MSTRSFILSIILFLVLLLSSVPPAHAAPPSQEPDPQSDPSPEEWQDFGEFLKETANLPPPETIRVGITGDWVCEPAAPYTVEVVDFKTYVKRVLPNEWYTFWPREALRAGAVSVKMYAWYWIERGGKWPGADVLDSTCDQWYQPQYTRESTNLAVDHTWDWVLTRNDRLFETRHKNVSNCDPPYCMKQSASTELAGEGYAWDEILEYFYTGSRLSLSRTQPAGFSLLFSGSGFGEYERVLIPLFDPVYPQVSTPVNVGAGDFTLEWYMKAGMRNDAARDADCGWTDDWINGNVIFDRDRPSAGDRKFGVSIMGGKLVFGVTGEGSEAGAQDFTLCGSALINDGKWRHVAVQRRYSDGFMWIFVDGKLDAAGKGPPGDISFPVGFDQEAFQEGRLVMGASRRDADSQFTSYRGEMDEVRFSNVLRYPDQGDFTPPQEPHEADVYTLALYHLDEALGFTISDSSIDASGLNDGIVVFGGAGPGPYWTPSDLFIEYQYLYLPVLMTGD